MEDYKTYIESGVLELYAMGDLSAAERLDVQAMVKIYPAIAAELANIEISLINFANINAVEPSNRVKKSFFAKIGFENELDNDLQSPIYNNHAKVVTLDSKKTTIFYKYSFVASFTLLIISLAALGVLYSNLQESKMQIAQMQTNNQSFANQVNYLQNQVKIAQNSISIFSNPDVKTVKLAGSTANSPKSKMMVMWNTKQKKVMIDMQTMDMPLNDINHQYQLWALVNGKPIDLGVFDAKGQIADMLEMKNIDSAQTFAVTLEPRGGSLNPTMAKLMLLGNIL